MTILIENIKKLVLTEEIPRKFVSGKAMAELNSIKNAWLLIRKGKIADFGSMESLEKSNVLFETEEVRVLDAKTGFSLFCGFTHAFGLSRFTRN